MSDTPVDVAGPAVLPSPPPYAWTAPEPVRAGPAPGYVYVGFWRRFVAALIDGVILTIVSYAILIPMMVGALASADLGVLGGPGSYTTDPATGMVIASPAAMAAVSGVLGSMLLAVLLVFAIQMLYHAVLWAWRGGTIGQLMLGIQVRREVGGGRIGFGRACLRYVGFLISGWILCLGFIWVAFDRRKQGWHDKIAGTLVVRRID